MGWPVGWSSLEPLPALDWDYDWSRWEPDIPRVSTGVKNRKERLQAIGNGQVPLCMAVAWELLIWNNHYNKHQEKKYTNLEDGRMYIRLCKDDSDVMEIERRA